MQRIKLLAATALLSTSMLMPTAAAFAVPTAASDPNAPTLAEMQAICDANYVSSQDDPTLWRASVTNAASQPTTPAPVAGTERNINHRPDTGSSFSYAGFTHTTNPLTRTGGSPNMWGQMVFNQKVWDNTLYDVEMQFSHDVAYTWTCFVEENVATTIHHPGDSGGCPTTNGNNNGGNLQAGGNGAGNQGCGNGNGGPATTSASNGNGGNNNGGNLQTGGNGDGNQGCGNGNGGPAGTNENCGNSGSPGWDEIVWTWVYRADFDEDQTNTGIDDGYDTTAENLQLAGHVVGVDYVVPGVYAPDGYRLLSCISPGKRGGAWTAKSWYTGGQCSTTTFNAAPTALGTTFDAPPTNSLPALP